MNRPDYVHMENIIIQAMVTICRDDNANREVDMTQMIDFIGRMHVTAIMTLVGAVLISTKTTDSEEKIEAMLAAVNNLIQAQDADFSMQLRDKTVAFVAEHDTADPFDQAANYERRKRGG